MIRVFFNHLIPTKEQFPDSEQSFTETKLKSIENTSDSSSSELHCLHVFHTGLIPKTKKQGHPLSSPRSSRTVNVSTPCITDLRNAGIKFKRKTNDTYRFWDIKYENGVLYIPRLKIQDGTKSLFLNLMAFEQCRFDVSNNITSYISFMDNLIDSGEDVKHLRYVDIIEHWLGSDQVVADLFNNLCKEVVLGVNDNYLSNVSNQLKEYCQRKFNVWKASLKRDYCSNPWAIISFSAAFLLILFTIVQTSYGVVGYHKPPK